AFTPAGGAFQPINAPPIPTAADPLGRYDVIGNFLSGDDRATFAERAAVDQGAPSWAQTIDALMTTPPAGAGFAPTIPGVGLGNAFAVAPNVPTSGSWLPYGGFGAPYAPAPPPGISPA